MTHDKNIFSFLIDTNSTHQKKTNNHQQKDHRHGLTWIATIKYECVGTHTCHLNANGN